MSLAVATRIARRELRGGLKGFRIFLACLAMGVAAIAAVGTVRASIEAGLAQQGAELLGGDAAIELTYRRASPDERAFFDGLAEAVTEVIDFRSMAQLPDGSDRALTQVKAIDTAWPLYGAPVLEPDMPLAAALAGQGDVPGAVMDPLLIARLELSVGDIVRLGDQDFVLSAALLSEPDNASAGFSFGPRTLVATEALTASGLIQQGTLFNAEYRLRLPSGTDLDATKASVTQRLEGSGPRWRDSRNGAPGTAEVVNRLGSFLVLVGLAGLAVGGVGISSAVRSYLDEKTATIAILKTLGADTSTIFLTYAIQILVLTVLGITLGLLIGCGIPLVFGPMIAAALPVPAVIGVHLVPLGQAALYGIVAAALFTLWPLARAEEVRAAALFRDAVSATRGWPRPVYLVATGLLLAALVGLAALFAAIPKLALWASVGIFAAFLMLLLAGAAVRSLSRRLARLALMRGRPALRMALASVGGPGTDAAAVVLSLGLGLSVLAAVGQIDNNLRGAIARDLPDIAPSFFVLDVQPDQIDGIRARVDGDPGVTKLEAAPMLRGVITQINGRPAEEVAGDHWVIRGDRGVTYSEARPDRTTLTAGEWWPEGYSGDPLISFSSNEAAEIGLSIGDTMTVNILGREITGTLASFRDVDFSTAGMGFTIAMNPAALAGAPHSLIATIYADEVAEPALLRDLSRAYPNITVISVRDAIAQVTGLMGQIVAAITYGALVTLATGAVVLIGAAASGERARTYEAAILKTLGASRGFVLMNFALRSAVLGAAAGVVAVFAGGMAGWAVSRFVMETDFVFEPVSAVVIVVGGIIVTLLAGLAFAWRPLSARPARVLRARE